MRFKIIKNESNISFYMIYIYYMQIRRDFKLLQARLLYNYIRNTIFGIGTVYEIF